MEINKDAGGKFILCTVALIFLGGAVLHLAGYDPVWENMPGKKDSYEYTFVLEDSLDKIPVGSSLICWIEGDPVLIYGKLRGLFGEPLYETEDLEDQYLYCLSAEDESGKEICLYAYHGPSGPTIGGLQDEESRKAAENLAEMIQNASAVDYYYEGYYYDAEVKVYEGIKDGVPFYWEESYEE